MAASNNTENYSKANERICVKAESDFQQIDPLTSTKRNIVNCFTNILPKFSEDRANILVSFWKKQLPN